MPAVSALSPTQLNTIRSGGIASEIRIAPCLNNVLFRATVNQTITSSVFKSFAWDGLISGAYTSVKPGQTVFITATSDSAELRNPIFRGRVTQAPTATVFFINTSSFNLVDGYIVTVIDSQEVLQKDRDGALVDGFQTYANLPPAVKNMQSFYYAESIGSASFSFAPTGQAMASGATISSYAWTISGAVYTVGSAATQNITVTIPYGRMWAYLDITDSNAVSNRFAFEILVCARDDPVYMFEAHGDVSINDDLDSSANASVTYFDGVENLLNRTRVAIIAFDKYKSGSGAFSNVMFIGYLVNEETSITADLISSTLSETRFEIQSFAAIAAQLPVPSLAIRIAAVPAAWEQIKEPTTQRVIWHLMTRYSTLGSLCAVNFIVTDSTWYGGNMDLEANTLLESINNIGEEIQAKLVFFPEGDAAFEINANFLSTSNRNALPDLISSGDITPADLFKYSLPLPYYKTVGQVEAGFATFYTSGAATLKLAGIAPATARQEGNESPVIPAQLLTSNLSQSSAITAAKQRIGDLLEYLNPPTLLNLTFHDGWRFLTLSTRVWATFDLPATDSTRGLAVVNTDRYLLQSLSKTWHSDGTWDVSGSARLETQGGVAQINVYIAPNIVETDEPILPVDSDYDAFPPAGTLNTLDSEPSSQPYDSLTQFQPMTTENAANVANNQNEPSCTLITPPVNMASSQDRATNASTIPAESYQVSVKGSGQISAGGGSSTYTDNMVSGLGAQTFEIGPSYPLGAYSPTEGGAFTGSGGVGGNGCIQGEFAATIGGNDFYQASAVIDLGAEYDISAASMYYKNDAAAASAPCQFRLYDASMTLIGYDDHFRSVTTTWTSTTLSLTFGVATGVRYISFNSVAAKPTGAGTLNVYLDVISVTYTVPGENLRGDAFYRIASDGTATLYDSSQGLRLDGSAISTIPEYSPNHAYEFEAIGTGAVFVFAFEDTDYSNNSGAFIIRVCGTGMY